MTQQKFQGRLGILGGMGPEATQVFYAWLLKRTPAQCDQDHIPTLILSDTQMPNRTEAILNGNEASVYARLLRDLKELERCGCSCIAIPCNTSHYFADRLQAEISVPILHMPRMTARLLAARGKKRAAILATAGTIRAGIYTKELNQLGMEVWTPDEDIQSRLMWLIYDVIKRGISTDGSEFAEIDSAVRASGCDCAILGCTELSVFRERHSLPEFYLDAMEVLVQACLDFFFPSEEAIKSPTENAEED